MANSEWPVPHANDGEANPKSQKNPKSPMAAKVVLVVLKILPFSFFGVWTLAFVICARPSG
jgi:hypothetical protein